MIYEIFVYVLRVGVNGRVLENEKIEKIHNTNKYL